MDVYGILLLLLAVGVGLLTGYLIGKSRFSRLEAQYEALENQYDRAENHKREETLRANEAEKRVVGLEADLRNLKTKLEEQGEEFEKMQEQLRVQFENLANKILEEKSKKFTEQNREKLDQLLKPLGEKMDEFRKRVEESHKEDIKGRSALEQHLKTLQTLNQSMTEEAKNLTRALKGDTKKQGNWGEVILQRILERSGLQKGREYQIQKSFTSEDGSRQQPDVIVHLPDDKHMVIDSKVSLKDYEQYMMAEEDKEREKSLKAHITSLKGHIRNLSKKNYQNLYENKSPDFVLMFVPIESAFGLAMQHEPELYNDAFDMNIIIVSPTTLLATLATIDNVWKQEYQNKNAMEIARRGGLLYDKFTGFVENMQDVGTRISQTRKSFDDAMGQLSTGSGNLVRQAQMLRELGARTSKQLPDNVTDEAGEGAEDEKS